MDEHAEALVRVYHALQDVAVFERNEIEGLKTRVEALETDLKTRSGQISALMAQIGLGDPDSAEKPPKTAESAPNPVKSAFSAPKEPLYDFWSASGAKTPLLDALDAVTPRNDRERHLWDIIRRQATELGRLNARAARHKRSRASLQARIESQDGEIKRLKGALTDELSTTAKLSQRNGQWRKDWTALMAENAKLRKMVGRTVKEPPRATDMVYEGARVPDDYGVVWEFRDGTFHEVDDG